MTKGHLLDWLAERQGCYISDLRLDPRLRRAALADLRAVWSGIAPLDEWRVTVRYLTGCGRRFEHIGEIKAYLAAYLAGSEVRDDGTDI